MYSWAGQLYTALRTEYQLIKRIGAGLTGFSVEKIAYRGRKKLLDNGACVCPRIFGKIFFCPRIARIFVQASAKPNDCVKPKDQREFIRFGLARNCTFKKVWRDAFASLQKYIITQIPRKLFAEYLCRQ